MSTTPTPTVDLPTAFDLKPLAERLHIMSELFVSPLRPLLMDSVDLVRLAALCEAWIVTTGQEPPTDPETGERVAIDSPLADTYMDMMREQWAAVAERDEYVARVQ